MKIALLVGSLRKESYSRKVALVLKDLAPASMDLGLVEMGRLPLYNQDYDDDKNLPGTWTEFRDQMNQFDGVIFVTPEYNRSLPAVIKNAIDVGSRPYGHSVWKGLPAGVVSVSPGAIGGFGANHHLRQSLVFLDVPVLQQPEIYLGHADKLFDARGKLQDDEVRSLLTQFLNTYARWNAQLRIPVNTLAA
jgi:chromate reductase